MREREKEGGSKGREQSEEEGGKEGREVDPRKKGYSR